MIEPDDINWSMLKREIEMSEPHETMGGHIVKGFYLGKVFNLTPSGKYYMPWASSNVSEKEASEDADWWEKMEEYAEEHGMHITSSEGDPTDIIIEMVIE